MSVKGDPGSSQYYRGTKSDLKPGDPFEPGYNSNYGSKKRAAWVYLWSA